MNDAAVTSTAYWDEWRQAALTAGVAKPLAEMGCEVLRAHRKNRWSVEFLGVEEDGPHMLTLCLEDPAQAEMLFVENLYPYDAKVLEETRLRLGAK